MLQSVRQCRLWANVPNANRMLLSPPHFSRGHQLYMNLCSCFWVSQKYCGSASSPLCVSPSLCPLAFLCHPLPLCVVLSPPSSLCMLFFIINQMSLSPAQAKSLYGGVRWGTHLPQSCWDFFLLSTFPLDGVLGSKTRVCSLDFAVDAALQVVSVWPFCC